MPLGNKTAGLLLVFLCLGVFPALAFEEIQIDGVQFETLAPGSYAVVGSVRNTSAEPREVTLRAQIAFFDKGVPAGDLPVAILRKDTTQVLQAGEERQIRVSLLQEGTAPRGDLRLSPVLRIRRQRPWNY